MKSRRLRKTMTRIAIVSTLAATAAGLTAPGARADIAVAYFTLQQQDWHSGTAWFYYINNYQALKLDFQPDGNLVLYYLDAGMGTTTPLWASGSEGLGITDLDWSQAGFVRLKWPDGNTYCTMGALNPAPQGRAMLQTDGNFVFYNTSGRATWATGTQGFNVGNLNYCNT